MANKKLVVVESPTKAKTIQKMLGSGYKVVATIGHLRDLPKSKLGIDIDSDFKPQYINVRGKASVINSLKKYSWQPTLIGKEKPFLGICAIC